MRPCIRWSSSYGIGWRSWWTDISVLRLLRFVTHLAEGGLLTACAEQQVRRLQRHRTTRATGKSVAQASDLQVRPNGNTNNTVRYGGKHLLYDIQKGHLAVLMTTHEARRLATQNTASGNDLRCKAIHDT